MFSYSPPMYAAQEAVRSRAKPASQSGREPVML